jgi:hypothetical protein
MVMLRLGSRLSRPAVGVAGAAASAQVSDVRPERKERL